MYILLPGTRWTWIDFIAVCCNVQHVLHPYDPNSKHLRVDKNICLRVYCKDKAPGEWVSVPLYLHYVHPWANPMEESAGLANNDNVTIMPSVLYGFLLYYVKNYTGIIVHLATYNSMPQDYRYTGWLQVNLQTWACFKGDRAIMSLIVERSEFRWRFTF